MKRAILFVAVTIPLSACGKGTPNGDGSTGGAGGGAIDVNSSGGMRDGGSTPDAGGMCNVAIASCNLGSSLDAGSSLDGGSLTTVGPYAVGHVGYALADATLYPRTVMAGVWYPVDPATLTSATPPASYPFDEWTNQLPVSISKDWEPLGYASAYEQPAPSRSGPFPLVMFSPGFKQNIWEYLYIGPRLASYGFVVAIISHDGDGQYPWIPSVDVSVLFHRPRDAAFAITELLQKSSSPDQLLYGLVDASKIAMSGHSLGGYATLALAGGDDYICETQPAVDGGQPQQVCDPVPIDQRIKAIVPLDGSSWALRWNEMARIAVPSLILGETFEHMISFMGGSPDDALGSARAHAAINRSDSHRVDLLMANHISFSNRCDGFSVMANLGVDASTLVNIFGSDFFTSSTRCGSDTGFDPTTNPASHQLVTTYMLAFLNTYLRREDDSATLTSSYARQYQPEVEFFDTEACNECPPGDGEFSYRPHPCRCSVGMKEVP